jgi:hypothetical protein
VRAEPTGSHAARQNPLAGTSRRFGLIPGTDENHVRPVLGDRKAGKIDALAQAEAAFEIDLLPVLTEAEDARLVID